MTTQDLGRGFRQHLAPDPAAEPAIVEDELGALFETSPAIPVHTSVAAELGFLAGLVSVLAAPFPLMRVLCLGLAALALVCSIVGLARASRAWVAGTLLASIGLVLSLATFALIGLRYAGIDTTVDSSVVPTFVDWLTSLNALVPRP
ncbi:MAG: hypothetical protein JWR90_1331 [Marmoricola sp.]|jgi:hypothetical protein|nr:hypothetical protein [Marmoricola sp.]